MSELSVSNYFAEGSVTVGGRSSLVWVTGKDAVSFLDGLLSQNIAGMDQGSVAPSLLLAPNGKMRATLTVLKGAGRVGLVCDAGAAEAVVADLTRFKIRVDAEIAIDERPLWETWSDQRPEGAPATGEWSADGDVVVFDLPLARGFVARTGTIGRQPETSLPPESIEALRIEAGEPVMGVDLTDKTIPQEGVNVDRSVDFDKGCYLGQELVARIDSRGHVNRRLVGVVLDDESAAGAEVVLDGKVVGEITSVAWSEVRSAAVAMGMIRVEVDAGQRVDVGSSSGVVTDLPIDF